MAEIKLVRIDDRLLHGQVSKSWVDTDEINLIVVANDDVVVDEKLKNLMNISTPLFAETVFLTVSETIASIKTSHEGKNEDLRKYLHGEHAYGKYSNHYIIDKNYKYIWYSQTGLEQFFDMKTDPHETKDLIENKEYCDLIAKYRKYLIKELEGREEGFVKNEKLIVGRPIKTTLN